MFKYYCSSVPGFLNHISSRSLEVAHAESRTEESRLAKERELQGSLFVKDVLGGNNSESTRRNGEHMEVGVMYE